MGDLALVVLGIEILPQCVRSTGRTVIECDGKRSRRRDLEVVRMAAFVGERANILVVGLTAGVGRETGPLCYGDVGNCGGRKLVEPGLREGRPCGNRIGLWIRAV